MNVLMDTRFRFACVQFAWNVWLAMRCLHEYSRHCLFTPYSWMSLQFSRAINFNRTRRKLSAILWFVVQSQNHSIFSLSMYEYYINEHPRKFFSFSNNHYSAFSLKSTQAPCEGGNIQYWPSKKTKILHSIWIACILIVKYFIDKPKKNY